MCRWCVAEIGFPCWDKHVRPKSKDQGCLLHPWGCPAQPCKCSCVRKQQILLVYNGSFRSPERTFLQEIPGNSFVPGRSAKGGTISREKDNFTVLITYLTTKSPDTCLLAPFILSTDCNTASDRAGRLLRVFLSSLLTHTVSKLISF